MKAVILAAGEGKRLGPFTVSEPKVMIPVANRPIVGYVVDALVKNGIREIVFVVGYKKERIMSYFEDGKEFGADISYVTQKKQLGTAHALSMAKEKIDDDFIVLPGDNVIDSVALTDLLEYKKESSVLITESDMPSKYGVVEISAGMIQRIVEKPKERFSNLISTGICHFEPSIFDLLEEFISEGKYNITDVLQHLAERGKVRAVLTTGMWADAVYPWDILKVNAAALDQLEMTKAGTIEDGVGIRGPVSIGEGTILRSGSYIVGPVAIGKGCDIGPNVVIMPSTSLGDNVRVAPFTIIKHSVLMDDVGVGSGSSISRSVLGKGVTVGPHFSASEGGAHVSVNGECQELENVGAFLGEDTHVESGVVVVPGSVIGARCRIEALKIIRGNVPGNSTVV